MEKTIEKGKNTPKATKRGKKTKKAAPAIVRRKYEADTKADAKDLYLRGVGLDRIARYLNIPERTLTNWQTDEHWREEKKPEKTASELKQRGYRVNEIAERLDVSEKTVRKWLKAAG